MTKRILTLALALAATGSAFAFGPKRITPRSDKLKVMSAELTAPQKVVTRAAEEEMSVDFTYADVPYSVTGLNGLTKGMEIYQAIGLSGDNLKAFAGDKVTSINITTGAVIQNNTVSDNDLTEVTVFISENLDKDPIYTQKGTLGTAILTENKVTLDTPYEIKENQPFYVGYYFTFANENLGYIVYDGIASDNDDSNIIGIKQGGQIEWMSFPDQIGALCIGCTITGENMPQDSVVLDDVAGPIYAEPGKEFQYAFLIKTAGYTTDSVELSYSIGDGETVYQTFDFEKTLPYNKYNIITIDGLVCNQVSLDVPLKFEVTKVNGVENKSSANKKTATIDCFESSKAFPWVHLIEEGTGTWCGWCPLGIVMMEYVTEKYPGLFACVAIHSQDAMTVQSTSGWLSKYASGFPCGYIDRSTKLTSLQYANLAGMQEQMDNFASVYQGVPSTMGFSELNVAIDDASGEMTVDSKVGSAFDIKNNNRYRLSYYITQNDMGPYAQTNSYAGGSVGDMAGWEKKGRSVKTIYNDVCRLLVGGVNGVSNSLPGEMVSGEQYSYSTKIDISGIKAEKFILIPFIVDSFTGNIMNSKVIEVENSYFAGVDEIGTDSTLVSRKFYNLSGVEVKDPSNGIYVVRSVYSDGTIKTEKAALK